MAELIKSTKKKKNIKKFKKIAKNFRFPLEKLNKIVYYIYTENNVSLEDTQMIKVISGEKGTGKTKIMLDSVNESAKTAKGNVVFIQQKRANSTGIDFNVRCIYTEEYSINGVCGLIGFVDGLMAGNSDIEYIFIDGILRIAECEVGDLEAFANEAEKLSKEYGVKFVLTVSCATEDIPSFLA